MTRVIRKMICIWAVSCVFALIGTIVTAAEWPTGTVKLVVPYGPGGTTDVSSRIIADLIGKDLGENIIVENRPGAGSTEATGALARGRNVENTLLMASPGHAIGPAIYPGLKYDPVNDFRFIRQILVIPNAVLVPSSSPYSTIAELVKGAKENTLTYGSTGLGASTNMAGELFKALAGVDVTHVPFKGSGELLPAVISGDVDMSFDNLPAVMSHIKAGTVRVLAVTTEERSPFLPDVPTVSEAGAGLGLEDYHVSSWFGLIAHKSFSDTGMQKMQKLVDQAMQSQKFKDYLKTSGAVAGKEEGEDFKAFIESEVIKWAKVAKDANITN